MSYVRDYENDMKPLSSWTRGELEALVTWLRTDKVQRKVDLKLALEANVVMRAENDQLRERNAQLEVYDGC